MLRYFLILLFPSLFVSLYAYSHDLEQIQSLPYEEPSKKPQKTISCGYQKGSGDYTFSTFSADGLDLSSDVNQQATFCFSMLGSSLLDGEWQWKNSGTHSGGRLKKNRILYETYPNCSTWNCRQEEVYYFKGQNLEETFTFECHAALPRNPTFTYMWEDSQDLDDDPDRCLDPSALSLLDSQDNNCPWDSAYPKTNDLDIGSAGFACVVNPETNATCAVSDAGNVYAPAEGNCYADDAPEPSDLDDPDTPPDSGCSQSSTGLISCAANKDDYCDSNNVCRDNCGSVNGVFACYPDNCSDVSSCQLPPPCTDNNCSSGNGGDDGSDGGDDGSDGGDDGSDGGDDGSDGGDSSGDGKTDRDYSQKFDDLNDSIGDLNDSIGDLDSSLSDGLDDVNNSINSLKQDINSGLDDVKDSIDEIGQVQIKAKGAFDETSVRNLITAAENEKKALFNSINNEMKVLIPSVASGGGSFAGCSKVASINGNDKETCLDNFTDEMSIIAQGILFLCVVAAAFILLGGVKT